MVLVLLLVVVLLHRVFSAIFCLPIAVVRLLLLLLMLPLLYCVTYYMARKIHAILFIALLNLCDALFLLLPL